MVNFNEVTKAITELMMAQEQLTLSVSVGIMNSLITSHIMMTRKVMTDTARGPPPSYFGKH